MVIGIDFDGTIVEHTYPYIGAAVPFALETLKQLQDNGHKLILWTMRSDSYLDEAVDYLTKNGITLYGINTNPTQKEWTNSPKAECQLYIDDAALGCPLKYHIEKRPYVDWLSVRSLLINHRLL